VPNSFTPNSDGINDVFRPSIDNAHLLTSYHLIIYDRWGTIVFETSDPDNAWTGDVKGGNHYGINDAYNWKLIYSAKRKEKEELNGSVVLIR
jgi:gliding motility-associated-like protein